MYVIYDTELYRYYSRSGKWVAKPKVWRESSAIKLCLHTILDHHLRWASDDMHNALYHVSSLHRDERLRAKIALIPDRYRIKQWVDSGIVDLGSAKEWYASTLHS